MGFWGYQVLEIKERLNDGKKKASNVNHSPEIMAGTKSTLLVKCLGVHALKSLTCGYESWLWLFTLCSLGQIT